MFVTSLPVPQVVGNITSSLSLISGIRRSKASVTLSRFFRTNSLDMSITVPPPMAIIRLKSTFLMSARIEFIISSDGSPSPYFSCITKWHFSPRDFINGSYKNSLVMTKSLSPSLNSLAKSAKYSNLCNLLFSFNNCITFNIIIRTSINYLSSLGESFVKLFGKFCPEIGMCNRYKTLGSLFQCLGFQVSDAVFRYHIVDIVA